MVVGERSRAAVLPARQSGSGAQHGSSAVRRQARELDGVGAAMFGYHGRYLRIDLSTGAAEWVPLAEDVLRRFVGGVGVGTYLISRENPPGVDPLSPAAALVFSLSPLVGTPLTTSAKFAVVAKS